MDQHMYLRSNMKHADTGTNPCRYLKCLSHAFFCTSKPDMNLLRQVVVCTPIRPANVPE